MYVLRCVAADDGDAVVGFWPLQTQCQPIICRAAAGNLSWSSLSSCKASMSAWWSASQFCTWGRRTLRELTFQVAIFMMFPCVLLGGKAADWRLWAWAVLYSGLVYFSIWADSGRPSES